MKRRSWLLALVAVAALGGALAWALRPRPVPVDTAAAAVLRFEQTLDDDGRTRVRDRYVVSAPLAGRLERVTLDPGDPVRAGQPVARIAPVAPALLDARTTRELGERLGAATAERARAEAELARVEAALEQARTDLDRSLRLQGEGFVSPAARDQAELAVRVQARAAEAARAARQAADHQVAQARAALMRVRDPGGSSPGEPPLGVLAPVDGRVLQVFQRSAGAVALGAPLLEIGDPADLEVVVDVLSTEAIRIEPGAEARIDAGSGLVLAGRVRRVEPAAFTKVSALGVEEQRVNVIVDLDPVDALRRLGDQYRVDVQIVTFARDDAVVVPVAALFRHRGDWAVFAVDADRAQLRTVRTGRRNGTLAWIEAGVGAGERVVVYPGDTLQDGDRVRPAGGPPDGT